MYLQSNAKMKHNKASIFSSSSSGYRSEIQYWNVTLTTVRLGQVGHLWLSRVCTVKGSIFTVKTIHNRGLLRCGWRLDCYPGMKGSLE